MFGGWISVHVCLQLAVRFVRKVRTQEGKILLRRIRSVQEYCLETVASEQRFTCNLAVIT